jgi:beta-N-acetylhexosaminidase
MTFSNNIAGSDQRTVDKVHQIIRAMVEKGEIKRERIDESFERIMKVKKQLFSDSREAILQQDLNRLQVANDALKNEISELRAEIEKLKTDTSRKKKRRNKS